MINTKSEIINKFFIKEMEKVSKRYINLKEEEIKAVENLLSIVKDDNIKDFLLNDFDKTLKLAKTLDNDFNETILNIYIYMNEYAYINITIEKAREIYDEIENEGYSIVDNHILYSDIKDLREYAVEKIEDMLKNSYEVDRLFDKDTLIDYFIEEVSLEQIANELADEYEEYENTLDIEPEFMFYDEEGKSYYYAQIK